jgi:phosphoribosylanthranilate isomerase
MRDPVNLNEVVSLDPDYIGFILFRGSPRYIDPDEAGWLASGIPPGIRKVAVLVDEPPCRAIALAKGQAFDLIQLHGREDPDYCRELSYYTDVIKAFPVSDRLPMNLEDYMPWCRMFLFDAAGHTAGGTGSKFDHTILGSYSQARRYLIGGGIAPADADYIRSVATPEMEGVDINSRFETEPGIKDVALLESFINNLRINYDNC